jgi:hypothetical protein
MPRHLSRTPKRFLLGHKACFLTCETPSRPEPCPAAGSLQSGFSERLFRNADIDTIPGEGIHACPWFAMGKFSPTRLNGDCEEIAKPSTAYGRRRRNWTKFRCGAAGGSVRVTKTGVWRSTGA